MLISLKAPAKINPVLEVLGKRPDGYHELSILFQAIDLCDTVTFGGSNNGLSLRVFGETGGEVPTDDSNLAMKAARLFFQQFPAKNQNVTIELKKKIPVAAGLGGGSSDAAAVLLGFDILFQTNLGEEGLQPLAEKLGSDVPFFLKGGTALGTGRGEIITPLPPAPPMDLVLVKPAQGLSTPEVYRSGKAQITRGEKTKAYLDLLPERRLPYLAGSLFNGLEPAAFFLEPETQEIKRQLLEVGALGALVSGSGPTVFGVAPSGPAAEAIAGRVRANGRTVILTRTISGLPD